MSSYFPAQEQPAGSTVLLLDESGGRVERTVLPGGLRVVSQSMPGTHSATVAAWIGAGSRHERPDQRGAAHYLEHLLFKGTGRRSALDISSAIDAVGGELNAFTSREYTCYYARVLDRDLPLATDVVLDVVGDPLMTEADVQAERGVVLEEIAMHEDDPADVVHEAFLNAVVGRAELARPVLGSADSISGLSSRSIRAFYADHYRPPAIVVCAAGRVDHGQLVDLVSAQAQRFGWLAEPAVPAPVPAARVPDRQAAASVVLDRPTEQVHLVLGGTGLTRTDPRRYAQAVLNAVLGGGMSSRLFFRVREERGLAYSVYSFAAGFVDDGAFGVYAGSRPDRAAQAEEVILAELAEVAARGLTAEELDRGRGQVRGGMLLGLEDGFARQSRLGKAELLTGELPTVAQLQQAVDGVTAQDVAQVAEQLLVGPWTRAVVGPV